MEGETILGFIKISPNKVLGYHVNLVAAESGYGLYMYLIAGGIIYKNPLTSDRARGTNKKAKKVIEKLYFNNNIRKVVIDEKSQDYLVGEEQYINTYYYITPISFIKELVSNINKGLLKIEEVKEKSLKFFDQKYLDVK